MIELKRLNWIKYIIVLRLSRLLHIPILNSCCKTAKSEVLGIISSWVHGVRFLNQTKLFYDLQVFVSVFGCLKQKYTYIIYIYISCLLSIKQVLCSLGLAVYYYYFYMRIWTFPDPFYQNILSSLLLLQIVTIYRITQNGNIIQRTRLKTSPTKIHPQCNNTMSSPQVSISGKRWTFSTRCCCFHSIYHLIAII